MPMMAIPVVLRSSISARASVTPPMPAELGEALRFLGEADPDFRTAVQSDVPTLILVGEFDPVTPPEWADVAAEGLSHASVFVFPAVGHGVLDSHVCASDLVRAFLDRPQAPRPPACLERL